MEKHSLVVAADFHMQRIFEADCFISLIRKISKEDTDSVSLICNPSTGQYARLPQLTRKSDMISLLGYDPIGKRYKVLALSRSFYGEKYILTLGTGKVSWRKIECSVHYYATSKGICINGILYFIGGDQIKGLVIACFDITYEKLRFLNVYSAPRNIILIFMPGKRLINYKGKLGLIYWSWNSTKCIVKLWLWILEDAQKQEWSKREYTLPLDIVVESYVSVFGVTASGEIILSMNSTSKQVFVFYFNPERNTLKKVEIQGWKL